MILVFRLNNSLNIEMELGVEGRDNEYHDVTTEDEIKRFIVMNDLSLYEDLYAVIYNKNKILVRRVSLGYDHFVEENDIEKAKINISLTEIGEDDYFLDDFYEGGKKLACIVNFNNSKINFKSDIKVIHVKNIDEYIESVCSKEKELDRFCFIAMNENLYLSSFEHDFDNKYLIKNEDEFMELRELMDTAWNSVSYKVVKKYKKEFYKKSDFRKSKKPEFVLVFRYNDEDEIYGWDEDNMDNHRIGLKYVLVKDEEEILEFLSKLKQYEYCSSYIELKDNKYFMRYKRTKDFNVKKEIRFNEIRYAISDSYCYHTNKILVCYPGDKPTNLNVNILPEDELAFVKIDTSMTVFKRTLPVCQGTGESFPYYPGIYYVDKHNKIFFTNRGGFDGRKLEEHNDIYDQLIEVDEIKRIGSILACDNICRDREYFEDN